MAELRPLTEEELRRAEERLRNPAPGGRTQAAQAFGVDAVDAGRARAAIVGSLPSGGASAWHRAPAYRMNPDVAVQALCDAGVEFVIIGGWSAILHGSAMRR